MDVALYNQQATRNPYGILILILFILCLRTQPTDDLKYLPILVKMNIIESQAKKQVRKIRKKMKELAPDVFKQTWLGTFDYVYCGHKIVGTVELRCNDVFSVAQNQDWLYDDSSNVKDIITYLSKNRLTEIPCWNSPMQITCQITLHNSHLMRYLFIPQDILNDRHSHHIKWEKKLVV
jgi:hypothetical protein